VVKLLTLQPRVGMARVQRACTVSSNDGHIEKTAARGYDAAWKRLRKAFLRDHPLCECPDCDGGKKRVTAASVVDHKIRIEERPDLRLDASNLRAMAKVCHDRHGENPGRRSRS